MPRKCKKEHSLWDRQHHLLILLGNHNSLAVSAFSMEKVQRRAKNNQRSRKHYLLGLKKIKINDLKMNNELIWHESSFKRSSQCTVHMTKYIGVNAVARKFLVRYYNGTETLAIHKFLPRPIFLCFQHKLHWQLNFFRVEAWKTSSLQG